MVLISESGWSGWFRGNRIDGHVTEVTERSRRGTEVMERVRRLWSYAEFTESVRRVWRYAGGYCYVFKQPNKLSTDVKFKCCLEVVC